MNALTIPANHPALQSNERRTVFLDEVEKTFSQRDLSDVVTHTVSVFSCVESMRKNAVNLCISLRELKISYIAARREANPDRKNTGWEAFCKANFEGIGLSIGHIRTAISTGEMLVNLKVNDPEGFEALSKLSRAALFAVSGSPPETVTEIKALMIDAPDSTVTAAQVRQLSEALAATQAEANALKQQLQGAIDGKRGAEELASDLNQRCLSMEDRISDLQRREATPPEAHSHTQPTVLKSEQEALEQINQQQYSAEQALSQTMAECDAAQKQLTAVQRKLSDHAQALDVLSGLNKDIGALTQKYSQVVLQKTTASNPNIKSKLRETAQLLRILADQLEQ